MLFDAPVHSKGDTLERDYTPPNLAAAACDGIAKTLGRDPKRILEAHVGGGSWVHAASATWPKAEIGVGDADPCAPGLESSHVVYTGMLEHHLAEIDEYAPDWCVGNPPFSHAQSHLSLLADTRPLLNVAWLLPYDIHCVQSWSRFTVECPPRFIRPVDRRVWSFVRGVAVFEWWNVGVAKQWATQVIPLRWTRR